MPARSLYLTALIAVAGAPIVGHSQAPADPLSGTWTGYIGRSEATPTPATFELKLAADGSLTGRVTGPELMPGEIKSGTFNRQTGALKFTVLLHVTTGEGGNVGFEGSLVADTVSGKMQIEGQTGVFRATRGTGSPAVAKTGAPSGDAGAALQRAFVEVSGWITRAAELVPADKYSWRPTAGVRTFGQLVGHVVDGAVYYCGRAAGNRVEWSDATEKSVSAKAVLVPALRQAVVSCASAYQTGGQVGPLVDNVGHSSLHYGNMVTYLRLMGLAPPSS